ncbi:hypothetical protein J4437_04590 [Candidatus Woesearchaeota archaeon]|nr:hypothetical protein [Candidatus Woesearchaeota archaeon]
MKESRCVILVLLVFTLVSTFLLVSCTPVKEDAEDSVQETIVDSAETGEALVAKQLILE